MLCSTGLPQIIQIIDRVLAFLCQWTHCFRFSGSSSCFSEISIPSFRPPLCPLRNLSWFFWMDAHRILIQSKKKKKKYYALTKSKTRLWVDCFFIEFGYFEGLEHRGALVNSAILATNPGPCLEPVSSFSVGFVFGTVARRPICVRSHPGSCPRA